MTWLPQPEVSKIPLLYPDKYIISLIKINELTISQICPDIGLHPPLTATVSTHLFMISATQSCSVHE